MDADEKPIGAGLFSRCLARGESRTHATIHIDSARDLHATIVGSVCEGYAIWARQVRRAPPRWCSWASFSSPAPRRHLVRFALERLYRAESVAASTHLAGRIRRADARDQLLRDRVCGFSRACAA